jgi:hypothetical protein
VEALTTAPKTVLSGHSVVVAAIHELDPEDAFGLALFLKQRVDHDVSALTDVVDPILVDQLPERDGLALPIEPFE